MDSYYYLIAVWLSSFMLQAKQPQLPEATFYPSKITYWFHMPVVPPLRSLSPESSRVRHLTRLATAHGFLPLISAILFVGLGNAVGGSYLTLYAVAKNRSH